LRAGAQRSPQRANHFTPLRLALAGLVIIGHAAELTDGNASREVFHLLGARITAGDFAVKAFFVISGYLILQSWAQQPSLSAFFRKRLLRIFPGFVVAYLISILIVGGIGGDSSYLVALFQRDGVFEFFRGIFVFTYPHTPPVFEGWPYPFVNGSLWTIAYEFRCYLLIPVLAAFGLYARPAVLLATWLAVTLGVGLYCISHPGDLTSLGLMSFVPFFLAGNCAYLYREKINWSRILGLGGVLAAIASIGHPIAVQLALPITGSCAVIWLALSKWSPLKFFPVSNDISYGTYLYGWPVQKLLLWYFPAASLPAQAVSALGLSLFLGWISWNLVEKYFLARKPLLQRGRISPPVYASAIESGLTPAM
jgi:peptidoglycan/LPS O-acetylase OafA/YrhL